MSWEGRACGSGFRTQASLKRGGRGRVSGRFAKRTQLLRLRNRQGGGQPQYEAGAFRLGRSLLASTLGGAA